MLLYLIIIVISYLIGTISTAYIIGKMVFGVDIRTQGSKNAGTTNVLRNFGFKAGLLTFLGDFFKGTFAVLISMVIARYLKIDADIAKYIAAIAVVCGHNWPVFLKFKGGKGVATTYGAMYAIAPFSGLACSTMFIIIAVVTGYASVASMFSVCLFPVLMFLSQNYSGVWISTILSVLVIYRHKSNIKRLLKGEERRIDFKKMFKKKDE